jgi:hypothetical protein
MTHCSFLNPLLVALLGDWCLFQCSASSYKGSYMYQSFDATLGLLLRISNDFGVYLEHSTQVSVQYLERIMFRSLSPTEVHFRSISRGGSCNEFFGAYLHCYGEEPKKNNGVSHIGCLPNMACSATDYNEPSMCYTV